MRPPQKARERERAERRKLMRQQVKDGTLVIRKATAAERREWGRKR